MKVEQASVQSEDRRPARERILDTAADLFYREGIRAVGVDTIIARSGVAKMSLYRNFASKDDLVVAYLDRVRQQHEAWWDRVAARHTGDPHGMLIGLFVSLGHWIVHPRFAGCPFGAAIGELRDPQNPAYRAAAAHKREIRDRLTGLAAAAGAAEPELLGTQLLLLMDGAYMGGAGPDPARTAEALVEAARALIAAALPAES